MDEQSNTTVSRAEMIRYVYQYAIYAIEDGLGEFQFDVTENEGWTAAEAQAGYDALKQLISSLQLQANLLKENLP